MKVVTDENIAKSGPKVCNMIEHKFIKETQLQKIILTW